LRGNLQTKRKTVARKPAKEDLRQSAIESLEKMVNALEDSYFDSCPTCGGILDSSYPTWNHKRDCAYLAAKKLLEMA